MAEHSKSDPDEFVEAIPFVKLKGTSGRCLATIGTICGCTIQKFPSWSQDTQRERQNLSR